MAAGNPNPGVATFNFGPLSAASEAKTRIRLAGAQDLVAVAKIASGSFAMSKRSVKVTIGGFVAVAAQAGPGPDEVQLEIDGLKIVTEVKAPDDHPLDIIYSGWRYRTDETQSLQMDDFENLAMVAVEYGIELWDTPAGAENKSCADCHGDVESMAGLKAVTPKWDEVADEPLTLEDLVNRSIKEHQGAEGW